MSLPKVNVSAVRYITVPNPKPGLGLLSEIFRAMERRAKGEVERSVINRLENTIRSYPDGQRVAVDEDVWRAFGEFSLSFAVSATKMGGVLTAATGVLPKAEPPRTELESRFGALEFEDELEGLPEPPLPEPQTIEPPVLTAAREMIRVLLACDWADEEKMALYLARFMNDRERARATENLEREAALLGVIGRLRLVLNDAMVAVSMRTDGGDILAPLERALYDTSELGQANAALEHQLAGDRKRIEVASAKFVRGARALERDADNGNTAALDAALLSWGTTAEHRITGRDLQRLREALER